ncbi:MAG: hypothetical protein JXA21_12055 [Anaerolineae bacterium]|nr:hypothetical protein [Anaerolineae bacterium]
MVTEQDFERKSNEMEIQDLLDALAELQEQMEVITAPLEKQITALEKQLTEETAEIAEQIIALQKAIKRAVITHGTTIQSSRLRAIYIQPRVVWDTKRLDGYAEAHPEIKVFRKLGDPSVRIVTLEHDDE